MRPPAGARVRVERDPEMPRQWMITASIDGRAVSVSYGWLTWQGAMDRALRWVELQ